MSKDPNLVYLVQTDTTVGFVSQNREKLNTIKGRSKNQPCLKCVPDFKNLLLHVRVPKKFKRVVRYSNKTTLLYPNSEAIRVVKEPKHSELLEDFGWVFSTSANPTNKPYSEEFAKNSADVVVLDGQFCQNEPSKMLKVGIEKIRRIR